MLVVREIHKAESEGLRKSYQINNCKVENTLECHYWKFKLM